MKKVKKLILALAATSLLASCGGRAPTSTDSQPQGDSSSQIVPPAGGSSGQPASQPTSQPGPGPQSEPGPGPQSEPGPGPQSEPGPGPQSEPTSEQSTPTSDPGTDDQGSIFEPVKESPVNELKSTDVVDLLREFDEKAKAAVGSSPFEQIPTAEQINQFVAMDNTGLLASAMKHNHFTKEEVLDLIDAAMPLAAKILPLIYGGQNTGPLQSAEGGVPQAGRKEMANSSGMPTWMQLLTDPEVKEGLINVLEKIDLDHLFATISDMENDKDHPLDLAYYVAGLTGGMGSSPMHDEFYFFEETNDEIEEHKAMVLSFREEAAEKERTALVEAMRVFANDDTLFPIIRLVKQLVLRGLKTIDPTAVMNDVMVLAQYFQALGTEQPLPKATAAEALANLAKILDNEFLSDADLEGLLNLLFDRFLAYWDAGIANPEISGSMIREMADNLSTQFASIRKLITAKSITSLFKLVRAVLAGCDENAFAAFEGQDVAALATIVENAYYGLTREERDSLEAIANYLGISIPTMFQDVARYDARTITSYFQNLYSDILTAIQTKWKINEYNYWTGRSGTGVIQNGRVDLSGWTITSSLHGQGRFSFDGAYSTAKLGRTLIPLVATFSDGTKWHLSEDVTVYPADGLGVGLIENVDSSSNALNDAWYTPLEYNYETLAYAVQNGSGDDKVSFNGHTNYGKMANSDMVGYVSASFTMTLREFFNAIDPNDPYGILKLEKNGLKLFLDLKEYVKKEVAVYINGEERKDVVQSTGASSFYVSASLEQYDYISIKIDGKALPIYIDGNPMDVEYYAPYDGRLYGTGYLNDTAIFLSFEAAPVLSSEAWDSSEEEPVSEPADEQTWQYFAEGSFNGWTKEDYDYQLSYYGDDLYVLDDLTLHAGDELVVYGLGDQGGETWIGGDKDSVKVNSDGVYTLRLDLGDPAHAYIVYDHEIDEEALSSEEEPLESSEEEVQVLLYATGSFNEWDQSNSKAYLMELDYGTVYKFPNLDLKQGAELKAYLYNAETESKDWFPGIGKDNLVAEATARYDLCVDIESGEAWLEYIGDYQGQISDTVYYLVGGFNNWSKNPDYTMTFDAATGHYVAYAYLTAGGMKITDSDGLWYPGGMGNDYVIDEDGNYQIIFDPSGNLADGYYGFFQVISLD